jgi:hypothetical protein
MATKDIRLGVNSHDIEIGTDTFDMSFVDGVDYIAQKLKVRLWFFLGEWFLDTAEGTPFYQSILVKNPDVDLIGTLLKARILETPGVIELKSFEFDYDNGLRQASVSFECRTDAGELTFSETIP